MMVIVAKRSLNFLQQTWFDSTIGKVSFHPKTPFLVIHRLT